MLTTEEVSRFISPPPTTLEGFERFVELFAQQQSFFYGVLAVCLSVAMGWIAGRLFALV